ncbi:MAG TPA: hypothetical protein VLK79_16565 [Gaiellales bacterium]|nr:hypothetical protein [Gaiellales bacterium]
MPTRRRNGRRQPLLPRNVVYRSIQAAGGPLVVEQALGISTATLKRWRRVGVVTDAAGVLRWAALLHTDPAAQLDLARRLAGLPVSRIRLRRIMHPPDAE